MWSDKPTSLATGIIQSARAMATICHENIGNKIDCLLLMLFVSPEFFIRTRELAETLAACKRKNATEFFLLRMIAVVTTYISAPVSIRGKFY